MQETNLYTITIPVMTKTLVALDKILDKAAAHADERKTARRTFEDALLHSRLVFDQFPFLQQVQVACDNAKGGAARLAEVEAPSFEDKEQTIAELKQRIEKTIAFLKTIKPEQVVGHEGIKVVLPYWGGKHMTGLEYATEYLLPNFFFHVTTAYAILRKNGLNLGKMDFIGALPLKD